MPNNANITNSLTFNNGTVQTDLKVTGNVNFSVFNMGSITGSSTFSKLYRCIMFIPNNISIIITLPVPSTANEGQIFTIRKFGAGGGQTVSFIVTGSLAVWVPVNSGTFGTSYAISTVWQATFISTNSLYLQIA